MTMTWEQIRRLANIVLTNKKEKERDREYYWEASIEENLSNDVSIATTTWQAVKNYFIDEKFEYTRQDLLNYVELEYDRRGTNTIDTYRNYLHKAGYLETIRRGVYRKIKEIPVDLSIHDVKGEAYGNRQPLEMNPSLRNLVKDYRMKTDRFIDVAPRYKKGRKPKKKSEFIEEDEFMI